jgi:predicted Fe-S protein YdhL (DUF1289 family)
MISPCINVCNVNEDGFCVGCYRSIEEIANWAKYTDKQRLEIMENISYDRMARTKISSNKSMEFVDYGTKRFSKD